MAATLAPAVREALAGDMTPKFLATIGPEGDPNIVPIISIQPWDETTLIFGEYLMYKSKRNLAGNQKVGILVITDKLVGWTLTGTFLGFQETGEYVEKLNRWDMLRYNAYTSIRSAGSIRVESVSQKLHFTKIEVLTGFLTCALLKPLLKAGPNGDGAPAKMPWQVEEKFSRLQAVRAGAYVGADGFPRVFPMLSCFAAGPNRLLLSDAKFRAAARSLAQGARVAVCVLTFDPIAYQVKGKYAGTRLGVGIVDLTESYSASPPKVGERLDRQSR